MCSSTVILGNELADAERIPDAAAMWLVGHGWSTDTRGWTCGAHAAEN
ncbi:hypothetical protein [Kribbella sp. NPDC049227]